jgi:hypothetical protein
MMNIKRVAFRTVSLVPGLILSGFSLFGQVLELDNDTLHVKLDLTRGGAIRYISEAGTSRNLVNVHDEGRYIQQSYYAGESLNRVADGQNPNWSPWSWNPIQVGDSYNNRAEILEQSVHGDTAYTRCIPMLWDMNNEPAEAEMEQWTILKGNVIQVHNKLTCKRTDDLWGEGKSRDQELPAVYPISALSNLYTYFGAFPFTRAPLSNPEVEKLQDGFWGRYQNGMVKENWMAFVDDSGWGMAVYTPICDDFLAGMAGYAGGEAMDGSTSYIAPVKKASLTKNSVYEYDYYLVIGSLELIRSEIYALKGMQQNAWEFEDELEGWHEEVFDGSVEQKEGTMRFTVNGENSSVSMLPGDWNPGDLSYLWMRVKNETAGDSGTFHIYSATGDSASLGFGLTPSDTEYRDVLIRVDTLNIWSPDALITRFRLEPVAGNNPGTVSVDFIRFEESLIRLRSDGNAREIVGLGNALQLYAERIPYMSAAEVSWSVDNPAVAGITDAGLLTAISGGIVQIRARTKDGSELSAPLGIEIMDDGQKISWEFINDVEGWDKNPHACSVSHAEEALKVTVLEGDPYVSNYVAPWPVGDLKYLWMRVRNETAGNGGAMYLFPQGGGHDYVPFPLTPNDTAYRDVFVDMRQAGIWKESLVINTLRLDANNGGEAGDLLFDFIRFREELVNVSSEGNLTEIEGLGSTLQLYAQLAVELEHPAAFDWSVDDPAIASVDAGGLVTSLSEGRVVVQASDRNSTGLAGDITLQIRVDHTSLEDHQKNSIGLYPNPAGDLLYLEGTGKDARISIISLTGEVLMQTSPSSSNTFVHVGTLTPGLYLLRIENNQGSHEYHRMIKK